jgi:hypothetical protein
MDMPPTRYRVVEQGRRLIVIDSRSGEQVKPGGPPLEVPGERTRPADKPRPLPVPAPPPSPPGRYAGTPGFAFSTARWFDNEAPRRITLNQDGQAQALFAVIIALAIGGFFVALIGWPVVLVLGFVGLQAKARAGLRTVLTTWLTALDSSE